MSKVHHRFCIIIGAGASGIIQAADLLRKSVLQPPDLQILERNDGYGGVWNTARYPGAACDVWSHVYQISWHRNPNWTTRYASGEEIARYYEDVADEYGLRALTKFGENVVEARWQEEEMVWSVESVDVKTGEKTNWTANVIVHAAGLFNRGQLPSVPGIENFKGESWHTLDWPSNAELEGKRVAVIGTGPSAIQIIPAIQPLVKSLTVYQRTIAHCIPRGDSPYSPLVRTIFSWIPFVNYLYYLGLYYLLEIIAYKLFRPGDMFAESVTKDARVHLEKQVSDPELREKLRPYGHIGCKRVLLSDSYYPTLQKENVELITDPPVQITETGIMSRPTLKEVNDQEFQRYTDAERSAEKNIDVDIIIWATGFTVQDRWDIYKVIGRSGKTLSDHFSTESNSLYGVAASDFPDFLLMFGPNSTTLWGCLIYIFELQSQYNALCIAEIKRHNANGRKWAMMPCERAETEWTSGLQEELGKLATDVTGFGCRSYYSNGVGRNTVLFPFRQGVYKRLLRRIEWGNYVVMEREEGRVMIRGGTERRQYQEID